MPAKLYTIDTLAELLCISTWTLRRMVAAKQIPHCRIRAAIRFTERHVEQYLSRQTVAPNAAKAMEGHRIKRSSR